MQWVDAIYFIRYHRRKSVLKKERLKRTFNHCSAIKWSSCRDLFKTYTCGYTTCKCRFGFSITTFYSLFSFLFDIKTLHFEKRVPLLLQNLQIKDWKKGGGEGAYFMFPAFEVHVPIAIWRQRGRQWLAETGPLTGCAHVPNMHGNSAGLREVECSTRCLFQLLLFSKAFPLDCMCACMQ